MVGVFIEHLNVQVNFESMDAGISGLSEPTLDMIFNLDNDVHVENDVTMDIEDAILDNNDNRGDDDEASIGDDYVHSEELVDIEWVGLAVERERAKKNIMIISEKTTQRGTRGTHNGYKVFNPKLDMNDPHFIVDLCFTNTSIFRAAVRQHSRVHERDIKFTKNEKDKSMMVVMKKECKLSLSKYQLYRAKTKVKEMGNGSDIRQYGLLWRYAAEIKRQDPETTVRIKIGTVGEEVKFKRFYVCWGALRKGFLDGCRPVIFLDGCHLKTYIGGILLCVVGVDANNGIYPIAYAVVEKEKKNSWLWFLQLLIDDLGIEESG
ncbi:hypothetical protein Cni_G10346 [Canna indica]|uniref:MULE transposase domain-containing protein n=1 Tax=Canna indica TaxID=4628 RepID=A0AAQ3K3X8_9LILI|nr:hypothetical protein Cni_G10346 [Canna indica]